MTTLHLIAQSAHVRCMGPVCNRIQPCAVCIHVCMFMSILTWIRMLNVTMKSADRFELTLFFSLGQREKKWLADSLNRTE